MPRGKKTCPDCNTELGVRTYNCPKCQYDFSSAKKEKYEIKKQEKEEKKNGNGDSNGKVEKISPIVAELLRHEAENPYVAPEKMNRDEHADRVLSYGKDRAKNLLHLSKEGGWGHVNWKKVEEEIGV